MQALQTNLDGKSKQYKDPALTHLFLMNNIHYMVRSVRRYVMYILSEFFFKSWMIFLLVNTGASLISVFRSEAKDLLGDDWVQRHRRIVQQHANQYKRNAWAKVTFYRIFCWYVTLPGVALICFWKENFIILSLKTCGFIWGVCVLQFFGLNPCEQHCHLSI